MSVWVVYPTCNQARHAAASTSWAKAGYCSHVWASWERPYYPGYFVATNQLVHEAFQRGAELVVAAADDLYPDPAFAPATIAATFWSKFPDGYGVLQPVGDKACPGVAEICGSPWFGPKWVAEAYSGMGPFYAGYRHFYADEELSVVAGMQNALWLCLSLTQRHEHWVRPGGPPKQPYQERNERHWAHDKALFGLRKTAGFPGSERCV